MNAAYMLGRILLSLVFVVAGIQKLMDIRATADMLAATKIPIPEQIVPYLGGIPKYQALGYLIAGDRNHLRTDGADRTEGAMGRAGADRVHGGNHHLRPPLLGYVG